MSTTQGSTLSHLIGSTEAQTSLDTFTTAAALGAAITIPANTLQQGSVLRGTMAGNVSTTGTPTFTLAVEIDSVTTGTFVTMLTTGALTTGSGLSSVGYVFKYWGTVRSTGATGTILFAIELSSNDTAANSAKFWFVGCDSTADTVDTTKDLQVRVTAACGSSSSSNIITAEVHNLYVDGI